MQYSHHYWLDCFVPPAYHITQICEEVPLRITSESPASLRFLGTLLLRGVEPQYRRSKLNNNLLNHYMPF